MTFELSCDFKHFLTSSCSVSETVKGVTTVKHIIEGQYFKHILTTFGDKLTMEEIDDMFDEFDFDDDGFIMTKSIVSSTHPFWTLSHLELS